MSDRDRSEFVALVAVVCTTVVFVIGLWSGTYYQSHYRSYEQSEAARGIDTSDIDGFWLSHTPTAGAYKAICDHPSDKDQADLCQQWRSATAAEEAASYGWLGLFFTVLGLIGLGGTVWFANQSVIETRRIGQAQTRAYLSIVSGTYSIYGGTLILKANVRNTGSSPSRNGSLNWRVEHIGFDTQDGQMTKINRVSIAEDTPFASVQAEGSVEDVEIRLSTDDGIGSELFDRRMSFVVKGDLQWTDVFGVVCNEPFSLVSRRDHGYVSPKNGDPPESIGTLNPIAVG